MGQMLVLGLRLGLIRARVKARAKLGLWLGPRSVMATG